VHGNVRTPGTYELLDGMTLADALMKAGGLTDDADPQRAEIARIPAAAQVAGAPMLAETLQVPLQREIAHAQAAQATLLQPHDAIFIRRDPEYAEPEFVTLDGEVRFPGAYAVMRRDERVSDLVRRAGGFTAFAYPGGATFTRANKQTLAVDLPHAIRHPRGAYDLVVQPGDILKIPRFTPTVTVEGAVYTPVTALYQEGAGVGYYVTQASGYRQDADRHNVVVISPNGRVRRHGDPEPGSRVVVPARPEGVPRDHLKDFSTLMSVIASMATTFYLVGHAK
jgi:protein involved in polysaccharide export with SLBB domain